MMNMHCALLLLVPALAMATNEFGLKFLADNKDKAGVITLTSGLQYRVLRAGVGVKHPLVNSPCECHYGALSV
jgi:FKBP-type peptidyl-prolyl cis-trans isomerase